MKANMTKAELITAIMALLAPENGTDLLHVLTRTGEALDKLTAIDLRALLQLLEYDVHD
jgi:hypothetical protein